MDRKEELEKLNNELDKLKDNYDNLSAGIQFKQHVLDAYKNSLSEVEKKLNEAKEDEKECKKIISSLSDEINDLKLRSAMVVAADSVEKEDMQKNIDENYAKVREYSKRLKESERKRISLSKEWKDKEKKYLESREIQDQAIKEMESIERRQNEITDKIKMTEDEVVTTVEDNYISNDNNLNIDDTLKINDESVEIRAESNEDLDKDVESKSDDFELGENKDADKEKNSVSFNDLENNNNKSISKITSAEAYAEFLKNVSKVGPISKFFIGKKLKREVKDYLSGVSSEQKEALYEMFTNPVTLINFKVPDAYSNAIIGNLADKKNKLVEEQAAREDIDKVTELIGKFAIARESKNARVNKPFKVLKNRREILMLGAMNKNIRETASAGKNEIAKEFGDDLKQFINNNKDAFGDTKEAHQNRNFNSREDR